MQCRLMRAFVFELARIDRQGEPNTQPPYYSRVQRRRDAAADHPRRYRGDSGSEIYLNPSGTMIIH